MKTGFSEKERLCSGFETGKTFALALSAAGVLGLGAFLDSGNASAISISDTTAISPAYQRYEADVAAGNGASWKIIPNKYVSNGVVGGRGGDSALPASYNLLDLGYAPTLKNQGSDGDCWAFATTEAMESNLKKTKGISYEFSPKQLDYLLASGSPYYAFVNSNLGVERGLGDGGNFLIASYPMSGSHAPVSESGFFTKMQANDAELGDYASWRQFEDINSIVTGDPYTKAMSADQLLGDRADYLLKEYGAYWGDTGDVDKVKSDVYNYGAAYVSTYAPDTEGCWDVDTDTIVDLGDLVCGEENGHAMAVIGWDDNHTYTDPSDGRTKTGAFLLQNSWGASSLMSDYGVTYDKLVEMGLIDESSKTAEEIEELKDTIDNYDAYEYVWLGYDFDDSEETGTIIFASVRDVEVNSYDKIYDMTTEAVGFGSAATEDAVVYTYATGDKTEAIDTVSVVVHDIFGLPLNFDVYLDTTGTGNQYQKIGTTTTLPGEAGMATLKLSEPIDVDGVFKVKAVAMSEGSNVTGIDEFAADFTISVYTNENESSALAVPDTGLATGYGIDAIFGGTAAVTGVLVGGGLILAATKNRKHLFRKVKFEKKDF